MRAFLLPLFVVSILLFNTSLTQNNNKNFSLLSEYDTNLHTLFPAANTTDSIIALAVSRVNPDSIRYFIQSLQNFGTRYAYADNHFDVAMWIKNEFERFGNISAELDSFLVDSVWMFNVVATLPGRITQEEYVLIGGHYDSFSNVTPMFTAPGADDDASGTSATLEVARVISGLNYIPDVTIKFIAFDFEELGLRGSKHYAERAVNEGMKIKLVINNDMIAYTDENVPDSKVGVDYQDDEIKDKVNYFFQNFTLVTPLYYKGTGPDDQAFHAAGYQTLFFMEDDFNPYYHSPEETTDKINMEYCAEIIKINAAVLLKVADMPDKVKDFTAEDIGDGNSVKLSWVENIESDIIGYKVSVGIDSSVYDTTYFISDTVAIVSGLQEGTVYYFGINAIDSDGNESFIKKKSMTPNSLPLSPQNFADYPEWHKVKFAWIKNKELDLAGYNIYRSETTNGAFTKINTSVISDTSFIDENMVTGKYYYYKVKAVDNNQTEGNESATIRSMAVSLDKGILLVDETKNGNGSLFDPTDEQTDEYYQNLLSGFYYNNYDIDINGEVKLADLGAFSTIIWQGNDNTDFSSALNAVDAIKKYLDYGGNMFFTGFSVAKSFNGNIGTLNSFIAGDFLFNYFKIDTSINKISALFISASPIASGYNFIYVDSSKSGPITNYHIRKVEAISANDEGTEIYTYNSDYDSTTSQGSMQGLPLGVEYLGNDYKTIILNIPLYYMNETQSRTLINYVLHTKFNELTADSEIDIHITPTDYVLCQNYPNPFNPNTRIQYAISSKQFVSLKVYDILGKEVAILVNEEKPAGSYSEEFNINNLQLSSGVYFYCMRAGDFVDTKKMILMK